jgi:hypothetical protein
LRAQLSSNELLVLLFNCLDGVVDNGQFKNLIIRYRMLEHVPFNTYSDEGYYSAGIPFPIVSQSQVCQYLEEKIIDSSTATIYKGAFGNNKKIDI